MKLITVNISVENRARLASWGKGGESLNVCMGRVLDAADKAMGAGLVDRRRGFAYIEMEGAAGNREGA